MEAWRDTLAALAAGNTRLVFGLSCALAGPLLHLAGVESGGFHFVGPSSSGKSTALGLAATVYGHSKRCVRTWRATANGLESIAATHNDGLLILDELGMCPAKEAGEAAYMLANGKGKARASRTGSARAAAEWRVLFLSSGEVKLEALLEGDRRMVQAGQVLRMASIPMDAGAGLGGFENLHGSETGSAFAQRIARIGESAYEAVGMEWLRRLASNYGEVQRLASAYVEAFAAQALPPKTSGQVSRVARRFGLAAVAGELATEYGLTGWCEGESRDAALACFRVWLEDFGAGTHEDRAVCGQVRLFLEQFGTSRFQPVGATGTHIPNRAGFYREGRKGTREYLVLPETFEGELLKGRDKKQAERALEAAGILVRASDTRQPSPRWATRGYTCWCCRRRLPNEPKPLRTSAITKNLGDNGDSGDNQ